MSIEGWQRWVEGQDFLGGWWWWKWSTEADGALLPGDRRQVRMVSGTTAGGTIDRTAGPKRCAIYQIREHFFFYFFPSPFLITPFSDLRPSDPLSA